MSEQLRIGDMTTISSWMAECDYIVLRDGI